MAPKAKPQQIDATRRKFLSSTTLEEYSGDEHINSEVIRSIIATTASHKQIS